MDLFSLVGFLASVAGIGAGASAAAQIMSFLRSGRERKAETVAQRIKRLAESLSAAAALVTQIEQEIEERSALVSKLEKDVETYNQVAALKKAEVEAVAQVLRGELKTEGRHSFWLGVGVNFFFFALGVGVTVASAFVTGHVH